MQRQVYIDHWRFEDGLTPMNPGNPYGEMIAPRGWYCWAYPLDNRGFEKWMKENCPTAECTHRFNSGDPMYTVHIRDDAEAVIFKLKWL